MPEITYLKSRRKEHLKTHYELRGTLERGQGGRSWWLMYDNIDRPPELIGPEENLPKASREELARLRAVPKLGQRRRARYIDAHLHFLPGQDHNGIPHDQNVDWLRQYKRKATSPGCGFYSVEKGYLVVLIGSHNEDYPLEIWESRSMPWAKAIDELDSEYVLVWRREEDSDE